MQMFAADLDGTLLRSDGSLSGATARELGLLRQAGVPVVVATARPMRMVRSMPEVLRSADYVICDNGCSTWRTRPDEIVTDRSWAPGEAQQICSQVRTLVPGGSLAMEAWASTLAEERFVAWAGHQIDMAATVVVRELVIGAGVSKIMIAMEGLTADELVRVIEPAMGASCLATQSGSVYVELGPLGVTKASALAALCAESGYDAGEVVACGDMPNDIEMLQWAGVGVAMGHAHPALLAVADAVTSGNDDDGVAEFLRDLRSPPLPSVSNAPSRDGRARRSAPQALGAGLGSMDATPDSRCAPQ